MSQRRLCEVKEAMRGPLVQLVKEAGKALPIGHTWSLLQCPYTNHCDKSGPCRGFTPANSQRVEQLKDEFFRHGFRIDNFSTTDPGFEFSTKGRKHND